MTHQIRRVGIDIDNTIADFMSAAVPLLKEHYGLDPDFNKTVCSIEEIFGINPKARPPGLREFLYEELHLFRNLPKLDEDIEQLTHQLSEQDVNIYMITARSPSQVIVEDTMHWLHNHGFKFTDIFFTSDKADLCEVMNIDVMLEDELGQVLSLIKANINVVIRNQPWNNCEALDYYETKGRIKRASNWRDMLEATKEFLK